MAKNVGLISKIGESFDRIAEAEAAKNPPEAKIGKTKSTKSKNNIIENMKSENTKNELMRVTVTMPPDLLEALEKLSWQRRKSKKPYTISHLIRESLAVYLKTAE